MCKQYPPTLAALLFVVYGRQNAVDVNVDRAAAASADDDIEATKILRRTQFIVRRRWIEIVHRTAYARDGAQAHTPGTSKANDKRRNSTGSASILKPKQRTRTRQTDLPEFALALGCFVMLTVEFVFVPGASQQ